FEHARAAVTYLRDHALGAATFLPLEHLPTPPDPGPADNGARWVSRHVSAAAPNLIHHLLGQVAIVEHLDEAEQLWRRNGVIATYVTPGGEVLGPTGRLHGGGARAASETEHSLLARKRQLRELEAEVERLAAVGAELTACRVDLASVSERVEALGRELSRVDEIERDLTARRAQAEQRQTQLVERRAWLAEERERTDVAAREVAVERDRTDAE